jgi:MSHA biogenesis protein MshJ
MLAQWNQILQRYMALSLRERMLVSVSLLVAIAVIWFMLLIDPMLNASKAVQAELNTINKTGTSLQQQLQALKLKQQQDPLRELKDRIAQLNQHIVQVDAQLNEKLHGLIAPKEMAKVLESVLQQHRELKLVKLQSLSAKPLVTESKPATETKSEKDESQEKRAQVFRHGLQLEFEGSYLATLAYLKALQALPWEFYWDEVRLQVDKYPQAKVTIVVHTLSLTEGVIGV